MKQLPSSTNEIHISHEQFLIYDSSAPFPPSAWSEAQFKQGFSRGDSFVGIRSLIANGHASLDIWLTTTAPATTGFTRVIAVRFDVRSEDVSVAGPEQDEDLHVKVPNGTYRLVVAQRIVSEGQEAISMFFEERNGYKGPSELLVADDGLRPDYPLVEL